MEFKTIDYKFTISKTLKIIEFLTFVSSAETTHKIVTNTRMKTPNAYFFLLKCCTTSLLVLLLGKIRK